MKTDFPNHIQSVFCFYEIDDRYLEGNSVGPITSTPRLVCTYYSEGQFILYFFRFTLLLRSILMHSNCSCMNISIVFWHLRKRFLIFKRRFIRGKLVCTYYSQGQFILYFFRFTLLLRSILMHSNCSCMNISIVFWHLRKRFLIFKRRFIRGKLVCTYYSQGQFILYFFRFTVLLRSILMHSNCSCMNVSIVFWFF